MDEVKVNEIDLQINFENFVGRLADRRFTLAGWFFRLPKLQRCTLRDFWERHADYEH